VAPTVPCLDLHFPPLASRPELPDRVALALDDLAPAAVHESDDDLAPTWRVFLADPSATLAAAAALQAAFAPDGLRVVLVEVPDEDWAARSQAHLTRVTVGRVTVAPPWDAAPPPSGLLVVVVPSTGFGTGHHPTTRLCLRMLQDADVAGRRAVDVGTGSGVLALTAWRLGASEIEAIDFDQDAIDNAIENVRLNGGEGAIVLRRADLRTDGLAPGDVVTANLTGALLCAQAPAITALVRRGGTLILSGILDTEVDAVRTAFAPALSLVDAASEDVWHALRLTSGLDARPRTSGTAEGRKAER
jgi:ribosomal protein L11 methyltransferase